MSKTGQFHRRERNIADRSWKENTKATLDLLSATDAVPVTKLQSDLEIDQLERIALSLVADLREEELTRHGWRRLENWDRNGPCVTRLPYNAWEIRRSADLPLDHLYRLKHPEHGLWYCSEPYDLDVTQMARLAQLAEEGWHIEVRLGLATHFPGRTLLLMFQRRTS